MLDFAPMNLRSLSALIVLAGCGSSGSPLPQPPTASKIKHLVVISQENHTFDSYFGRYCKAATGSNPTCTAGPECCEAGPGTEPGMSSPPVVLDDTLNADRDPDHSFACETEEVNGGKMDGFVKKGKVAGCADARNFAYAPEAVIKPYWDLARSGALADRYFQPILGQTSANDMYFARAAFVFDDNSVNPKAIGVACGIQGPVMEYTDPTIADLLIAKDVGFTQYIEGYQVMLDAQKAGKCPAPPKECGFAIPIYPCNYDPTDIPFQYYASLRDNPKVMRDFARLFPDLQGELPAVSFVKALGFRTEHPGHSTNITDGEAFVARVLAFIAASRHAQDTLVLLTYDEGGGYFDHVAPPPTSTVDNKPYGTRVPTVAIGPFAKKNFVSHVTMEHSSIVKFIEWNWLGKETGQLKTRDATVNNIGSLLDPAATGEVVPE